MVILLAALILLFFFNLSSQFQVYIFQKSKTFFDGWLVVMHIVKKINECTCRSCFASGQACVWLGLLLILLSRNNVASDACVFNLNDLVEGFYAFAWPEGQC